MIPAPDDESAPARPPLTPLSAVMLAFIGFALQILISELLRDITGTSTLAPFGIGTILGYGAAFALGVAQLPGEPAATLGFRGARPRSWVAALLFVPSPLLSSEIENVIREHWPPPPPPEGVSVAMPVGLAATIEHVLVLVFVLPVVSEIFFRGLLQPRLVSYWGSLGAVIGAALLAIAGRTLLDARSFPVLFVAALLPGLLRRSSGSIYPGLLLSMSLGLISVLALHDVLGIPGFDRIDVPHTPLSFLVAPAAMLGIGLALSRGDASLTREDAVTEVPPPEEPPAA